MASFLPFFLWSSCWWGSLECSSGGITFIKPKFQASTECRFCSHTCIKTSSFLRLCHGGNFCPDRLPRSASTWHLPVVAFCAYCKFPHHSGVLSSVLISHLHLSLGLPLCHLCLLFCLIL